jgi:peptidoglycan hydrolase CwlO-like protein
MMEVQKIAEIKNRLRCLLPVLAAAGIALLCGAAIGYQYRAREDVYVERAGVNDAGAELERVSENQRGITEDLQRAGSTVNDIAETVNASAGTVTEIEKSNRQLDSAISRATELNRENQRIIEKIRARGKTN